MALTVEGAAQGGLNSSSSSSGIFLTTSGIDRIVVIEITTCAATPTAVTSVTATGLTFAQRSISSFNDGTAIQTHEVWWAYAAAQQTSNLITVNHDLANTSAFNVFAVAGADIASPWDANGSLPATATNTGGGSVPSVSGVSTTANNTILLEFIHTRQGTPPQAGSGYTTVGPSDSEPVSGPFRSYEVAGYKVVSAAQSSITVSGGNSLSPWGVIVDAIDSSPTSNWASIETPDTFSAVGYPGIPGIHGDLLITEAKDAFAAVGFQPVIGLFSAPETPDHFSAFGYQPLTGTLAATEARDVLHATGIGLGEDGVFITTEAVDIFAAVGNTPISGSFDTTEPSDRFFAFGAGVTRVRRRRTFIVT